MDEQVRNQTSHMVPYMDKISWFPEFFLEDSELNPQKKN